MKPLALLFAMVSVVLPAAAEVRSYGPLRLDFRQAKKMDDSVVIPAKNQRSQLLFVGIHCEKRLFNFTGAENQWKNWSKPETVHEVNIVKDVCNQI